METRPPLDAILVRARLDRKLTHYAACQMMRGVSQQQLINLEHLPNRTRTPEPSKITIAVVAEIVAAYWPDVQLEDFLPDLGTPLRFTPRDSNASRRLKGYKPTG